MPAAVWIAIGLVLVLVCAGAGKGKRPASRGKPVRIDHPHCFDEDDHECSVCGARFRGKGMVCPGCGAKFTGTREDDGEFVEEMVLWDDEDD